MSGDGGASTRTGLALSGGGSRAAAFHLGTLQALEELGLIDDVGVVSSVSGGSVFAAGWLAAKRLDVPTAQFRSDLRDELSRGFVARALSPGRAFRLALPHVTRTQVLGDLFDDTICRRVRIQNLPTAPLLCLNTTVLNHAQTGRFSREGFSTWGLGERRVDARTQRASYPFLPVADMPLGWAAAASAAFPVGLPPLNLPVSRWFRGQPLAEGLEKQETLALSDGGVLENLGVQTLIKSGRFGAWDLIVSDAGTRERAWTPGAPTDRLKAFGIGGFGGGALAQVMTVMNDKENRWMRESILAHVGDSWARAHLASANGAPPSLALTRYAATPSVPHRRRRLIMTRVATRGLDDWIERIPAWRLVELSGREDVPDDADGRRDLLARAGVVLDAAAEAYALVAQHVGAANAITTGFTALTGAEIDLLAGHARWQVLAGHAVYWD